MYGYCQISEFAQQHLIPRHLYTRLQWAQDYQTLQPPIEYGLRFWQLALVNVVRTPEGK